MASSSRLGRPAFYRKGIKNATPRGIHRPAIEGAGLGLCTDLEIDGNEEVFRFTEPLVAAAHMDLIDTTCDNNYVSVNNILNTRAGRFMVKEGKRHTYPKPLSCGLYKKMRYCTEECQKAA